MYKKNYDTRNNIKKTIDLLDTSNLYIKPRHIRYAKLGVNIGNETDGKKSFERPVIILNKVGSVFRVLPMTTKGKDNHVYYHKIISLDFGKPSYALLSQIRTIDKKRLHYPIGILSRTEFSEIKKSLRKRIT